MAQCWVEVDLEKVRANFRALQVLVGGDTRVVAVVKADAYGLGAVEVGRALASEGARYLAVSRVEEGLALRQAGIEASILLMSPAPAEDVEPAVEGDLTLCISTLEEARAAASAAAKLRREARCGLKLNTGMNRYGVEPDAAVEMVQQARDGLGIGFETCWTHFADAGEARPSLTQAQFGRFNGAIGPISRAANLAPSEFHCANSSALLRFPSMRLSCVRSGTLLFGQFPSADAATAGASEGLKLADPFAVKARVLSLQRVPAGGFVGYGGEWRAPKASLVATLGIGFADGLSQAPDTRDEGALGAAGKGLARSGRDLARGLKGLAGAAEVPAGRRVWWSGPDNREHAAALVGRIAMQCCHVDVTHLAEAGGVRVGDAFRLFQRRTSTPAHLERRYLHA